MVTYRTRRGWLVDGSLPADGESNAPTSEIKLLLAIFEQPARGRQWVVNVPKKYAGEGDIDRYFGRFTRV